jgi:hypothetical protein
MLGSSIGRNGYSLLNSLTSHRVSRSLAMQSFRAGLMTTLVAAAEVRPARARLDVDTLRNGHRTLDWIAEPHLGSRPLGKGL